MQLRVRRCGREMNAQLLLRAAADRVGIGRGARASLADHLNAAVAWIKRAHDVTGNGGVAQTYLVRQRKWASAYPETTGYIIPTLYRFGALAGDDDAVARARRMADWECE